MASRALLRRKRLISDYLCASGRSVHCLSYLGHGEVPRCKVSDGNGNDREPLYTCTSSRVPRGIAVAGKVEPFGFQSFAPFREERGILTYGPGNGSVALMSPFQTGRFLYAIRNASTAAAKKHEMGSDNEENEEVVARRRKEASAEDCDQAVAGLSSAKAKAKAKQVQDSSIAARTVLQRVWASLLGIGPALRVVASMSREGWAKKLVHWKSEFVSTLQHYWLGTKLLWEDVRISSRLLIKLANGKSLSRREGQQLTRTTADIFRPVPFAVFIIVPFMEFLLPVFLKLFPNMLPSTFQDKTKEQEALKRRLQARIEYARFLQDTVKEMAKEVQNSRSGEIKQTAEDLDEFLNRVRTGAQVSNEEILSFAKLFNDELTLDNISRPRLVNMCKYMGISPFGTDHYLRYMLRKRLQRIKEDDKLIQAEGIESLSEAELREDCRERGMLGILSMEEMRQQLRDWLDLSLNHSVPSSLLILSRSFTVSGKVKPEEAVGATLSSIPDEVVDSVGFNTLPSEDSIAERRRKLEYLAMQEELIKEEEGVQELISNLSKDGGKPFFPMALSRIGRASLTGLFNKVSVSPPISSNAATLRCFYSVDAHTQSLREKFMDQMSFLDINSQIGSCMPLAMMRIGTIIHNIEMRSGQGGKLVRAAGTCAKILKEPSASRFVSVRMPSGIEKLIDTRCKATIGQVSNPSHESRKLRKAGQSRWLGRRPVVRGVAMNPVDHPHGGGEGRSKSSGKYGRTSVSPWGKPTKSGYKTGPLKRKK